ncbi:MAG: glycosyltransferase family 4 protein [Candidatus Methylomirabilales bacterium]
MKILMNAYQMTEEITGTDRFAFNVLRHLQTLDAQNEYIVVCRKHSAYIPGIITASNFTIRLAEDRAEPRAFRMASRIFRFLRRVLLERPDLSFSFHNLSAPLIKSCPTIVSNLDLIPVVFPDLYYDHPLQRYLHLMLIRRATRVGDRFISISAFSKDQLVRRFGVNPSKVLVVSLGIEEKFVRIEDDQVLRGVKEKYGLPNRYILTAGSTEPRKNVVAAIKAYSRLPRPLRREVGLVVIGRPWRGRGISSLLATLPLSEREAGDIVFPGSVEDDDLPAVYSAADVFLYPSLYEGFGLPPLEAMACGTPVVCSNTTALPEVVGDAGILVDPHDPRAISERLAWLFTDRPARDALVAKGLAHAKHFSWEETTLRILQVFRQFENSR